MNISKIKKPKETNEKPKDGDRQHDASEHLCESCGQWDILTFWDVMWVCQKCYRYAQRKVEAICPHNDP